MKKDYNYLIPEINSFIDDIFQTSFTGDIHNSGVLDLKERLEGIYILTRHLFNYYERNDQEKPISPRILIKHLEESLSVKKIRKIILYFLTDVIRAYFGLNIIWEWEKLGEKIDGLWQW